MKAGREEGEGSAGGVEARQEGGRLVRAGGVEARRWNRREQYKTKGTRGRVKAMREGEGEGDAGGAGGVEARALCQIYYCYAGSSEADVFICETGYGRVGF